MAKYLFTDIDLLREYADVGPADDMKKFNSHQRRIQNSIIVPLIGRTMLDALLEKIDTDDHSEDEKKFMDKLRAPAAILIDLYSTPERNITKQLGGYTVSQNENFVPASRFRINDLMDQLGYNAQLDLNELLVWLEANGSTFIEYWDSEERKQNMKLFVNKASVFQKYTSLKIGHFMYSRLIPVIERIEESVIQNCICHELYDDLKTKVKEGTDLGDYAPILPLIQRAVVHFTLADALDEMSLSTKGDNLIVKFRESNTDDNRGHEKASDDHICRLQRRNAQLAGEAISALKKHLDSNTDTYTIYADSECSTPSKLITKAAPTDGSGIAINL